MDREPLRPDHARARASRPRADADRGARRDQEARVHWPPGTEPRVMNTLPPFGAILAGGRNVRYGAPKALGDGGRRAHHRPRHARAPRGHAGPHPHRERCGRVRVRRAADAAGRAARARRARRHLHRSALGTRGRPPGRSSRSRATCRSLDTRLLAGSPGARRMARTSSSRRAGPARRRAAVRVVLERAASPRSRRSSSAATST